MQIKELKLSFLDESEFGKDNICSSCAMMLIAVVLVQLPVIHWAMEYKPVPFFTLHMQ